jgi:glycosyltransferase involved in cell wall biosynthesis
MESQANRLVSIITPTYNHEGFIGPCIESVIAQDYPHWEQIIIDDGSTDRTPEVVQSFQDPRIRYFRQANRGPFKLAETYNFGLRAAKGELIAILEGDDLWPSNKLARLVPALSDKATVIAYGQVCDLSTFGYEQRRMSRTARLRQNLPQSVLSNDPVGTATFHMLFAESASLVMPSTVVIQREFLENVGGFQSIEGLPLTDYPTFLTLSLKGKFFYTPEVMGYRRHHFSSVTAVHGETIFDLELKFVLDFLERHKDSIRLTSEERKALEGSWEKCKFTLKFSQGRTLLTQKKWSEARTRFRQAMRSSDISVLAAAVTGYVFSFLHLDVEPLTKLAGRPDPRTGRLKASPAGHRRESLNLKPSSSKEPYL